MKRSSAHVPFAPNRCPVFYGWPVLAMGTLGVLMSVPGQTMGVSVFTDSLLSALGLTRDQLSTAYMLGTLGSAALLPWAGRVYDRLGSRISAAIASFCLAWVLVLLSASDSLSRGLAAASGLSSPAAAFAVVFVGFFALRLWGQGVLTLASHNMIAKWFDRRRGLACGLSGVFVALGFSSAPLVLDLGIRHLGWRGAWLAMAAVLGAVFLPMVLAFFRDNPEACGLEPDGGIAAPDTQNTPVRCLPDWTLGEARQTGVFWVFSLGLALSAFYMTGLTFHIVSVFEQAGMGRTQAVAIFLPASAVAVTVHLVGGWVSDRVALKWLLGFMLAGLGISMTGLTLLAPGWPVALMIFGNGLSGGLFGLLSAVTWAKFFGRTHLGAIGGFHLAIAVFHSALGPVFFSQSLTWTGAYRGAGLLALMVAVVLLAACLCVASPRRERQGPSESPPECARASNPISGDGRSGCPDASSSSKCCGQKM